MPAEFLKRVIERASDSLAKDVYQRILLERRAAQGQMALHGTVPTWEDIAARAVAEAILTWEEGTRFVAEVQRTGGAKIAIGRRGVREKGGSRQGATPADESLEDSSSGKPEKPRST
ncbi:MAG TPA: hypothetical protein VLH58_02165 [Candidatus Methylomirabilis sp.]|nr:hypothetical protein [Candidatus Methylomirabilis sp.]HSD52066.1 hypothetical protein [Candidatus Methylomirabilis sp.]